MTLTQLTDMQEAAAGVAALPENTGEPDRLLLLCQLSPRGVQCQRTGGADRHQSADAVTATDGFMQ